MQKGSITTMAIYNKILFATDLSPKAQHAQEAAFRLAREQGGEVHLLHVNVLSALHMEYRGLQKADDYVQSVLAACRDSLQAVPEPPDLRIERSVITDESPGRAILDYADKHGIDLIVMGTDHVGSPERYLTGSTVLKVLHGSRAPVLVTGNEGAPLTGIQRMVVGTDLSDNAAAALRHAAELAGEYNAELLVSYVLPPPLATPYDVEQVLAAPDRAAAEKALGRFLDTLGLAVTPQREIRTGRAHLELMESVKAHGADLLVVGASGHGALGRIFLGSTADRVVQHARCPVLVHRAPGR
ncbi:universal stress protein [Algiphilus sp.]|uniref:universal stress protein n=2 Tax=Algiphilus sp. TaxID=1872431 RepID=UPI002A5FF042|nr:universal stress protein [Pseudomonadota bacterium]